MSISTLFYRGTFALCLLLLTTLKVNAQRIYADDQRNGRSGLLCVNCVVNNAGNAVDGNPQTFSTINVAVGIAASTYQELIFTGSNKPAPNTPIRIKLGTGDNLADLTLLGGLSIRAYNGASTAGPSVGVATLLTAVSNNNQFEVSITPTQTFDRIRITLNGGLVGVLSSIYVYDAYYNGNGPVACNTAVDELHGISAGLLNLGVDVGGVANPQNAIDGDLNTASTLNAGVSIAGAYAQQTIIFQSESVVGDSVRMTLSIPQTLIDAGVLSRISLTSFLGNASNNDEQFLSSSLLYVRLLDLNADRRMVTVTFAPTQVFDRVQLRLGSSLANALSSLNLYEAERLLPKPVINYNNAAATNVQACAGSSVTLTATAIANTTFNWYTAPTGGTAIFTGSSFTTPVLNVTTTYYVSASRVGCTNESERTAVTITVNQIPAAPVAANSAVMVCPGQTATFSVQAVAGVSTRWYTSPTGGTPIFTGNTFTSGALNSDTTFYAEALAGGTCVSTMRTAVTATISPVPAVAALQDAALSVCVGESAVFQIASPQAGIVYHWYTASTGGTPIFTGTSFTTPALTANTTYYIEAENATGCTSPSRAQAQVTVVPLPANPTLAANNNTIAAGQTATIAVTNTQTGVSYQWYTSANASTPVFTGYTYTTPQLYSNTTYYVEGVNATGCISAARTSITINVSIDTNAPCTFANDQSSAINGLCIGCSITNRPLAVDADTTTASTISVLAGLLGGYAEQELLFQQGGFAGDTVKLVLGTPVGLADASVAGLIQVRLYNGATLVSSLNLDNSLVKVRLLGGSRYEVLIPAAAAYDRATIRLSSGVASLLTSIQVYYASQQFPAPVFNPASPEICSGSSAQINITAPTAGTFSWYTAATGGTPVFTGANFTTPTLTANTTYYVENNRNGCGTGVRYAVQVLVNDPPVKPVVNPPSASINSGQTTTFTATVANNVTVKWYTDATGGTPIFTGKTFTTPALSSNTTYYAESSLGDCVNPDRTAVPVTVIAIVIPDVAVVPPTQSVDAGESATLTASSTTPGTIFNWYTTPSGGTSIYTGAVFNSPMLFGDTTYYAEAVVQATGARSATRAQGVISVNATGTSPVPCDAAISQTTDINALLCLGCTVANADGSVDADRNTFSRLSVPVGLLNAYAQQTLRFANTGRAGDSVIVELGVPGTLASVNLLSQIQLATYNGATYNNDRFTVDGSLLSIRLLDGASRFRVAFKANADFDRMQIRMNSAVAGLFNQLNIYDASVAVAAPQVAASSVTICEGTQATLTATVPNYVTVRWYTVATGGSPIFTGNVFNTPVLTANTTYYAEATHTATGCAQTQRTPVTVTVTPTPATPMVVNATATVCAGEPATFTAQVVPGVVFNWYSTATGGTPVFTGAIFTTPALTATTSYYAEATSGDCVSPARTKVTANVTATPLVPQVAQTLVETCSGSSATLNATSSQAGVTFKWYTTATGGSAIYTGAQYTTPALTANTTYYVEAVSGDCVSATRAEAEVVVNPTPQNAVLTVNPAGGQISSGETATITATSATSGANFRWYTTATGGTAIFTGATFTTPALTGNTTYYVEAFLPSTGCISAQRTAVTIIVNPVFSTDCDFAASQTADVNGGLACVNCEVNNGNNAVNTDTADFSQLNLPVAVLGSYVSQTLIFGDGGIPGDTVKIKLSVPASLASAGVLQRIQVASYNGATYNNDRVDLSNNLISLQILAGGQTAIVKFVPTAAYDRVEVRLNSAIAALFNSLNIYYSTKQVEVPQLAASTVNICSGNTATFAVANARAGVIYRWYTTATGGTAIFTGATFTSPVLNATTTYYVESAREANGCANPNRVAATANVTPTPVTPVLAQDNVEICAGESVTLNVTNADGATVRWYNAVTGGTLLHNGATYTIKPVSNAVYYAELSNGSCTSPARAVATITVNPKPAMPVLASANVEVCRGDMATLQVTSPEAGVNYNWYTSLTGGTAVFTGAAFTTGALTADTVFYVEAANATTGCINNGGRQMVSVGVNGLPGAPILSATNSSVCNGGSITLSVTNPVSGRLYRWYDDATGGTIVHTGSNYTLSNVTANVNLYVEAVSSTGCASTTRTQTTINVLPIPEQPVVELAGGGSAVCAGSSATLNIVNADANLVYRWYITATGGTAVYTGSQFATPVLNANATYYIEASSAGNCNASARTAFTISVTPLPATPVLADASVTVCAGSAATFSVASPQSGFTYNWYASAAKTTVLFSGTSYTTGALNSNTTFYVEAVNANGCSSSATAMAQAMVIASPMAPVIAEGSTVQTCEGSAVTLTIDNPDNDITYSWYTSATGGTAVFTGTLFTTPALTAATTYYAEAVTSNGGCNSASRTVVNVEVNPIPPTPVITVAGGESSATTCAGSSVTLTATSTTPGVSFNWYTSATGGTAIFTGNTYTTPVLNATTAYYVEAVSATGGCTSATRANITIDVTQPPATPVPVNATVTVCAGDAATLAVSSPQAGLTYRWYSDAGRTNLLFTGESYTTAAIGISTTFYLEAANGECVSNGTAQVQVNVNPAPAAPAVANVQVSACDNAMATLAVTNAQANTTYHWYASATGGTELFAGDTYTPVVTASTTFYVEAVNATGCSSAMRTPVQVTILPLPDAPQVAAADVSVCPGTSVVLNATVSGGATVRWYDSASGGNLLFTGSSYATPSISSNTSYYAEAVAANGQCLSATRTMVTVSIYQPLIAPVLSLGTVTDNSITVTWNSIADANNYQISINNGQTFNDIGDVTTYTLSGLAPGTEVTFIVKATANAVCQGSAESNALTAKTTGGNVIFIPNAFTPNGDGNNDILYVYGSIIKSMNLYVYTQWGERIFWSNNQASGWDGTYKGSKLPVGVYVYYMDAVTNDGQKVTKKGTITLLR